MNPPAAGLNVTIMDSSRSDLRASPGQFFLATGPTFDPYLPQVVFPFRLNGDSVLSFIVPQAAERWMRHGDVTLRGPFGRGFALPRDARRALALATDVNAAAHLVAWLEVLVQRGCEVTLLCPDAAVPESWLVPEIEFRVVRDLVVEAASLRDWAEVVFASGTGDFYDVLSVGLSGPANRIKSGWAQALFRELEMPCGMGLCYACAFRSRAGVVLSCSHGPVLDLADWVVGE